MKTCKFCGMQSSDDSIRCSSCGMPFDNEFDTLIATMNSKLNDAKSSLLQPVTLAQSEKTDKTEKLSEITKLNIEIADLKNQLFSLKTEVSSCKDQLAKNQTQIQETQTQVAQNQQSQQAVISQQAQQQASVSQQQPQVTREVYVYEPNGYGMRPFPPMYYAQPYMVSRSQQAVQAQTQAQPVLNMNAYQNTGAYKTRTEEVKAKEENNQKDTSLNSPFKNSAKVSVRAEKKSESGVHTKNKAIISLIGIILCALSISAFFFVWINDATSGISFTGKDGIMFLINQNTAFKAYLDYNNGDVFGYLIKYNYILIYLYAGLLVLSGIPQLMSLFTAGSTKCRFKAWHLTIALLSLIVGAGLIAVYYFTFLSFSAISIFLYVCVGANALKLISLFFYK